EDTNARVIHFIAKRGGVGGGVEEERLEAIEGFQGEGDAIGAEGVAEGLISFNSPFPFIGGAAASGQIADRGEQGSGLDRGSCLGDSLYASFYMGDRLGANGGVIGDEAEAWEDD